jgi:hypothetical protein
MTRTGISPPWIFSGAALAALLLPSCTGYIGGGGGTESAPGNGGPASAVPVGAVAACTDRRVGPSPVRRLTHSEYNNTVRDLLNDTSSPADRFPTERGAGDGFSNQAMDLSVSPVLGEGYVAAAETLAANAVKNLGALLPCNPAGANEDACARQFIEQFGKKAYRRPLESTEAADLFSFYKMARTTTDLGGAIGDTIQTILGSPWFLYRLELGSTGVPGTLVSLTQHELASRLSYLFWESMPDSELFAAADGGQLKTFDQLAQQARRLLADPRSRAVVDNFYLEWLQVDRVEATDKDAAAYPEFNAALRTAMKQETLAFINHVLREADGRLDTFLTAPVSFLNADLAKLYGVTGVSGSELTRVDLPPLQRAGILTQPSILAVNGRPDQSDPIHRGKMVRTRLLCQELPPDVMNDIAAPNPGSTTKERFAAHRTAAACSSCHAMIDLVGFGFENYDGIGRWRTMDGNIPVDNTGEFTAGSTQDIDGTFQGVPDLARKLAGSEEMKECVGKQSFRYAFGRKATIDDACSLGVVNHLFAGSKYDLRELLIALTQTDAFFFKPTGGGQ